MLEVFGSGQQDLRQDCGEPEATASSSSGTGRDSGHRSAASRGAVVPDPRCENACTRPARPVKGEGQAAIGRAATAGRSSRSKSSRRVSRPRDKRERTVPTGMLRIPAVSS
jgi:hypothetical protein